jgi:hypothetical protein
MIPQFEKLNAREQDLLMRAPVLLSVLASCSDQVINETQKADAIKLAHIKTFTAIPMLRPYFLEVEKNFQQEFEKTAAAFYPFDETRRAELKAEVKMVQETLTKLNSAYAEALSNCLQRYASHVKRATHSIFRDFVFPLVILDLKGHPSAGL